MSNKVARVVLSQFWVPNKHFKVDVAVNIRKQKASKPWRTCRICITEALFSNIIVQLITGLADSLLSNT